MTMNNNDDEQQQQQQQQRQQQQLDMISVNPFVNHCHMNGWLRLYTYTIGIFLFIIRLPPFIGFIIIAVIIAKLTLLIIAIGQWFGMQTECIRKIGRNISIFLLRTALFFAGFYWIRMVDQRPLDRRDHLAPIICAAPHSSFFDILLILKLKNPTFVSRKENLRTPLIGNILRLYNGIYVDRHNKDSRTATIQAIMDRTINHGEHVLIFPEGTTANRKALLQFKLGAFLPRLPIQPVLIRYENCCGLQDPITWTWEGPGSVRIFFNTMSCLSIDCEITIMEEYRPNDDERQDPKKFSQNVAKKISFELGILQSYYSYDDVPLMPLAKQFRLFRSPICILMLKLADKIRSSTIIIVNNNNDKSNNIQQPVMNQSSNGFIINTNNSVFDGQNNQTTTTTTTTSDDSEFRTSGYSSSESLIESYKPINMDQPLSPMNDCTESSSDHLQNLTLFSKTLNDSTTTIEFQHLPISNVRRRIFRFNTTSALIAIDDNNRLLYEIFCRLIEHCITVMEMNFQYRIIESSNDLLNLWKLSEFIRNDATIQSLKGIFIDFIKMLEMTVALPITTMHVLIILHLCDIREYDLWERIRVAIRLFDRMHPSPSQSDKMITNEPYLTMNEFQTLLWYSIGLNEFNDYYFLQNHFDYRYIRENLCRLFWRAVNENAPQLIQKQKPPSPPPPPSPSHQTMKEKEARE
nr:uncharacterized protein LOC124496402 [Dermatophagoides farinae]